MEKLFYKWIAVDWGTTSFRAYLIVNNDVLENVETIWLIMPNPGSIKI